MALRRHEVGDVGGEPVPQIEVAVMRRPQRVRPDRDIDRAEIGRLAGIERHVEALAQPAGEADMVRVEMRDDDLGQRSAAQHAGEQLLPDLPARRRVDAGVERGKAALVLDQTEIDVVEAERQRQPRPQDAVGDLDRRAEGWRLGVRVTQARSGRAATLGGLVGGKAFNRRHSRRNQGSLPPNALPDGIA